MSEKTGDSRVGTLPVRYPSRKGLGVEAAVGLSVFEDALVCSHLFFNA